jgi:hypothetical protein
LDDPYDCGVTQFFGEPYRELSIAHPEIKEHTFQANMYRRLFVYLNCWHMNDNESAALWHLYTENRHETIAIQTTFGKLESAIRLKWPRDRIHISKVKYDPQNAGEPVDGNRHFRAFSVSGFENIIYKRPSFAHERELRAFIYQECDEYRERPLRNEAHLKRLLKERPEHIRIEITPSDLIQKVYVSPLAREWFVELVRNLSGALKDRVKKSDLYELY